MLLYALLCSVTPCTALQVSVISKSTLSRWTATHTLAGSQKSFTCWFVTKPPDWFDLCPYSCTISPHKTAVLSHFRPQIDASQHHICFCRLCDTSSVCCRRQLRTTHKRHSAQVSDESDGEGLYSLRDVNEVMLLTHIPAQPRTCCTSYTSSLQHFSKDSLPSYAATEHFMFSHF